MDAESRGELQPFLAERLEEVADGGRQIGHPVSILAALDAGEARQGESEMTLWVHIAELHLSRWMAKCLRVRTRGLERALTRLPQTLVRFPADAARALASKKGAAAADQVGRRR